MTATSDVPKGPWQDPRAVLRRHGMAPNRNFSQNFLIAPHVVERILEATDAQADEWLVELGPGVGTLTQALLPHCKGIVAVERDRNMVTLLQAEFADDKRLRVVRGDARTARVADLLNQERGGLVGNLPYSVSGAILRNLTEQSQQLNRAVLMLQLEVADRLVASAGSRTYGALSVFVQNHFDTKRLFRVASGCFHPRPKVESAVVKLVPHARPVSLHPRFSAIVKAAFGARRKTLRNALLRVENASPEVVSAALDTAGVDPGTRAERLDVECFARLAEAWTQD